MEASTRRGATAKAGGGGGGLGFLEAGTRVWVPHAAKAFCCAEVVGGHHASGSSSSSGQHLTVAYVHDDGNEGDQPGDRKEPSNVVAVARADVLGRVEDNWLTPLDDLVDLAELSEPAILHHIKQRHARDLIYARDLAPPPAH
jgi:myosin heavy subunit